jgi:TetR/AcrR family transcriptional regulator, regulator of biofilm formation and stress response
MVCGEHDAVVCEDRRYAGDRPPGPSGPAEVAPDPMTRMTRVRNEQRRRLILEATVQIVGREGPGAVTHRAVAAEAGVPLAATTYYFASKEELLDQALTLSVRSDLAELEVLAGSMAQSPASVEAFASSIAGFLVAQLRRRRTVVVAQYELVLEAARRSSLRPAARASTEAYVRLCETMLAKVGSADPAGDARLLVAVMDGLLLDQLSTRRSSFDVDALARRLRRFIEGLLVAPA